MTAELRTSGPTDAARTPAIVLIAHGSRRVEANEELLQIVGLLQDTGYRFVVPAYLELADPDILTAGGQCVSKGARQVVLTPYFLSAGRHVAEDLETARQELGERHPGVEFRLAGPLGPHALLGTILCERIAAALA